MRTEPFDKTKKVGELDLRRSGLQEFPEEIFNFTNLEELFIHFNEIEELPDKFNELQNLQELKKINLTGNNIKTIYESIKNCKKLERLALYNNPISDQEIKLIKERMPGCKISI